MSVVYPPGSLRRGPAEEPMCMTVGEFWIAYGEPPQWPICEAGNCEMPAVCAFFNEKEDECWCFCFTCAGRPKDPAWVEEAGEWVEGLD